MQNFCFVLVFFGGGHHALTKQKKDAEKNECSGAPCFPYERLKFCELKRLLFGLRVINQKSPWCISRWWQSRKNRKNRSICWGTDTAAWLYLPFWALICPCGKWQNQKDPNSIAIYSWILPSRFRSKVPKIHSSRLKSSDNKYAQREWFYLFATAESFGVRPHPCRLELTHWCNGWETVFLGLQTN